MSESYPLEYLNLPPGSEVVQLIEKCPDVQLVRFLDGEYIVKEGETDNDIYLVLHGSYVVEQAQTENKDRQEGLLAIVSSDIDNPSFVGEMAYFGACPRTASVRNSFCTHTVRLKPYHLDFILDNFPLLTGIICRQFTERLKKTNMQLKDFQKLYAMKTEQLFRKAGEVVFQKGDKADRLYQLVDGILQRDDETDRPYNESSFYKGFIDPKPYFQGQCYAHTFVAVSNSILATVDLESRMAVIRNYPELILHLMDGNSDGA